ncbi:MAG TPA: hypothetical protein VMY78_09850 [Solirubrobacteraceae bacterium]|nr:hypothetical protein [Solirubrobacteraceae bacterium]
MPDERRPAHPRREDFTLDLIARRLEKYEDRLNAAIDRFDDRLAKVVEGLRSDLKRVHEDFDARVDELEEWHLADTAITGERMANRATQDRRWVRYSAAGAIIGVTFGILEGLHII